MTINAMSHVRQTALRGGTLRVGGTGHMGQSKSTWIRKERTSPLPWELFRCCLLRTLYSYNGKPTEEGGAELRPDLATGLPEVSSRRSDLDVPSAGRAPLRATVRGHARSSPWMWSERWSGKPGQGVRYAFYYSVIRGFDDHQAGTADSIAGLETPDDHTLVVRLEQVTSDLAYRFSLAATAPIPEGADEGHDRDYGRFLVASGPYMVEGSGDLDFSVLPERQEPVAGFVPPTLTEAGVVEEPGSLVLVRNPSWDPTDPLRAAYPDRIELTIGGRDDEEIARRVDTAEVDLDFGAGGSPFEQVDRYREDPALADRLFRYSNDVRLRRNDEPRGSALRRRPRPACGRLRDGQGGPRGDRVSTTSPPDRAHGGGRDARCSRCARGEPPSRI